MWNTETTPGKCEGKKYRIPCGYCDAACIGEACRRDQKEWQSNRCLGLGPQPDREAAQIVETELHHWKRRTLEAILDAEDSTLLQP